MRTTITRIIGSLALLLLGCPAGTMAQINNKPEYYQVKQFASYWDGHSERYAFTDAQYYDGKLYAIYSPANMDVGLAVFDVNGETGQMDRGKIGDTGKSYLLLNSGGVYQDAELVVFRNRLYCLWKNNTSGQIWIGEIDIKQGKYKKTRMLDDGKTYANFGATIYRDQICVVLHRRTTDKLQVYRYDDPDLNSGWNWCGSVQNGANDNIKLAGSTSISSEYTPDDHWDVETWYGKDYSTGKMVEKLIIGRVHDGNFEVFSYGGDFGADNHWPTAWDEYVSASIGRKKTFGLKLIQAGIEGYTSTNINSAASNPLLFSYCTYDGKDTGEHFLKEYFPGSRSFKSGKPIYTDLPYGYAALATAAFPTNEVMPGGGRYYKQYLYIVRGNSQGYHWYDHSYIASIRSNELIENRQSFNDEKTLFTNPDLRHLVRLVGIVEGPPPTIVDNNDWFKSLGMASSLDFTIGSGTSNSVSRTYKSDLKTSLGPHKENLTAQIGGGYSYRKAYEEVKSSEESITVSFRSEEVDDYRAIALYSVPIITRCDLEYLTTTGRNSIYMPTLSYIYMTDHYIKQVELPLGMKPFGVSEPARLESWQAREVLNVAVSENVYRKSVGFSLNTPQINMRMETSGTISDSQTKGALSTLALKVPFFSLENQSSWEWTDATKTTTSQGISATFSQIRKSDPFVRPGETVESFASTLYLLTAEQSKTLQNIYYPDLLKQHIKYGADTVPLMVAEDKPFLLAWDINNITYTRDNLGVTGSEGVADEPLSIRFVDGRLAVDCLPGATVNVYRMDGSLAGRQQAVGGKALFSLPGQLYTVEIVTPRYRKVRKVTK